MRASTDPLDHCSCFRGWLFDASRPIGWCWHRKRVFALDRHSVVREMPASSTEWRAIVVDLHAAAIALPLDVAPANPAPTGNPPWITGVALLWPPTPGCFPVRTGSKGRSKRPAAQRWIADVTRPQFWACVGRAAAIAKAAEARRAKVAPDDAIGDRQKRRRKADRTPADIFRRLDMSDRPKSSLSLSIERRACFQSGFSAARDSSISANFIP